jgi:hypothetical protein
MRQNVLPARARRRRARSAVLIILAIPVLLAAALALWQWRTIGFIFNTDTIQPRQGEDIRAALLSGSHGPVTDGGDSISYRVLEDSVEITVDFDAEHDNSFRRLEAAFNAYNVPVTSVPDALRNAQRILSPYLGGDEVKAVGVLLGAEIPKYVFADVIDYRREIGTMTITVRGRTDTGDILVTVDTKR